jgi:glyoxylase-like metal-dependent hydrolase (beta-lactamase superfamily II)
LRLLLVLLVLALLGIAAVLAHAHWGIRHESPRLPDPAELRALASASDRPTQLRWIETAKQCDPTGYCITHPVFVLEWQDGRVLLVDTGMTAEGARAFGTGMEWVLGSSPAEVGRAVDVALGSARARVAGLVFTHLHVDHTDGLALLCHGAEAPLRTFVPPAQLRANHTTLLGVRRLESESCARQEALPDEGAAPLPGFPGVAAVRVGGHTPGSQLIVAWVGDAPRGYVLAGDVVFEASAIEADRPKPWLYRWLVTPENDAQLGRVRDWLRELQRAGDFTVLPSHDRAAIVASGVPEQPAGD